MAADTLSAAILNQNDPEIVSAGLPAYLLVVDGFIIQSPENVGLLVAGAQLFALYGSRFAETPEHGAVLTEKSRRYGERAICLDYEPACDWADLDYDAFVAELERVEQDQLDVLYDGGVHVYLGILNALRPPALGGQPEVARSHFERAIEISEGSDLSAKVEYARRYGRMMFDRDLHDRLLTEVLASPAEAPGRTLFNVLAKRDAEELLASSAAYF
jgi:hypothetical protein